MTEFVCEHCGKKFEQESSLRQHVNDKHVNKLTEEKTVATQKNQIEEAKSRGKETIAIQNPFTKKSFLGKYLWYIIAVVTVAGISYGIYSVFVTSNSGNEGGSNLPIGRLGSTHIHADFAIFLDGNEITPLPTSLFLRNQFIHVESGPGAGSVIHMHATNIPLNFFFRSVGMNFDANCFTNTNGQKFCNEGNSTLKMYVKHEGGEWEQNFENGNYIFKDLDKILISYGNESEEEIKVQQDSVTDFSRANSGPG